MPFCHLHLQGTHYLCAHGKILRGGGAIKIKVTKNSNIYVDPQAY